MIPPSADVCSCKTSIPYIPVGHKNSQRRVQGYAGLAFADSEHQVIVGARAEGVAQEQATLPGMVEETRTNQCLRDPEQISPRSVNFMTPENAL